MKNLLGTTIAFGLMASTALAQQAQPPQAWAFRCPAANTIVEANDGIRFHFRGALESDRLICLSGTDFRRALGVWDARISVFQSGMRELAGLFPATAGRQVVINYFDTDASQNSVARRDVFRIVGFPQITIASGTWNTVQIERFAEFNTVNAGVYQRRDTIWISTREGIPVKATYEQLSGRTPGTRSVDWEAIRVIRPTPPRPAS